MVARLDSAPLELALQIVDRDRAPLDPNDDNRDNQQGEDAKRHEARDCRPAGTPHEYRARASAHVEPLVSPPLVHWPLLTPAAHDRSSDGMTLPSARLLWSSILARTSRKRGGMHGRVN